MKEITSEQKYFNTLTEDKRIEYFKHVEELKKKNLDTLDTTEFLFEARQVRIEFVAKARDDWWLRIGVDRVVFEDILIMYDQMMERLKK